ncbi:MAG: undecaprenyldiphospho-muramoylpentapeptide beta-N-acetylglucosaminyltransferase [Lachnospiraceae bacterium]|nr:undecaprenyldiphospho-muramoylpentapeptide beta-N-acetylglucosaminyltransferase [Lachnospiraceae bacterium]
MKRIVLTGGGTAGHVTPNIALMPGLRDMGFEIHYIGSYEGIEKDLIRKEGVSYYGISSGKLRRYFDVKNITDPARILKGYAQAKKLLKQIGPSIVFSKGGFVAVPVVFAAASLGIPVVIHEADMTPGLANKLSMKKADHICCSFTETIKYLPEGKSTHTGLPIRAELKNGSREEGLRYAGLSGEKPVVLSVGGSTGSLNVNRAVRSVLPELLKRFDVIHLCGAGNVDESLEGTPGYVQFDYIREQMKDLLAAADVVISRAGANSVFELLALAKPNVLIPLSAEASRGDQILNAHSFEKQGFSEVIEEQDLTDEALLATVEKVYADRAKYTAAMEASPAGNAVDEVLKVIAKYTK